MGRFSDWWSGKDSDSASESTPETRDEEIPIHDASTATTAPSRNGSPTKVSPQDALSLGMVFRAVQIIATAVSQMSLDAYRQDQQLDSSAFPFIRQPDIEQSRPAFFELTTTSLACTGNAYWMVRRDNQGRVTNLTVLDPSRVEPKENNAGQVIGFSYGGKDYSTDQIRHLKLLRLPWEAKGFGPIQAANPELRGALDTRDYASNWFAKGTTPGGVLSSDQNITNDVAEAMKARWLANMAGNRDVAVIGNGLKYAPIFLSPRDAMWIEARNFDALTVARIFGIPASMLLAPLEGSTQTYQNIGQAWTEFHRFTLTLYTREIEMALSALLPRGTEARFNFEALLRADTATRYQAHASAIQAGWMSINEVRAIEGLEPAPDGDFKSHAQKVQEQQELMPPKPDETSTDQQEATDE